MAINSNLNEPPTRGQPPTKALDLLPKCFLFGGSTVIYIRIIILVLYMVEPKIKGFSHSRST